MGKKVQATGQNLKMVQNRWKNKLKKLKKSHSSYWMSDMDQWIDDPEYEPNKDDRLIKLAAVRRAIANFVKLGSGSDIPVQFSSGKNSYTDGTTVVISATDKPEKFDSQVGLALHEASHIKYSGKSLAMLRQVDAFWHSIIYDNKLPERVQRIWPDKPLPELKAKEDLHFVMNILEDRRIDATTWRFAPGYRPYYKALYGEYFDTRANRQIAQSVEARIPTVENYFFWLTMIVTDYFDIKALPDLDRIINIMDIKNIERLGDADPNWKNVVNPSGKGATWEPKYNFSVATPNLPALVADAVRILQLMYDNAIDLKFPGQKDKDGEGAPQNGGQNGDLPNLDIGRTNGESGKGGDDGDGDGDVSEAIDQLEKDLKSGKVTAEDIKKSVEHSRKFAAGQTKKKNLSAKDQQRINDLVEANAELKEAGKDLFSGNVSQKGVRGSAHSGSKVPVIIYKEMNPSNIAKLPFGSTYAYDNNAVKNGIAMGNRLAQAIRIMNDDKKVKYIRQVEGHIERRLLAELGFGNDHVFSRTVTESIQPVHVHYSIDASGSMSGTKWTNAMTLAMALAVAAEKIRTFRLVMDVRAGLDSCVGIGIFYDSKKDKPVKLRKLIPFMHPTGSTPEGLAFEAIMDTILERSGQERKYFINISDGQPAYSYYRGSGRNWNSYDSLNYSGETAAVHTAKQVQQMKESGTKVLSYYVEDRSHWDDGYERPFFRSMYGQDAAFIDPKSIPAITMTLNKLFLS